MSGSLVPDKQAKRLKLAVIHWFPIEYYPPVTNLANFLADKNEFETHLFTTQNRLNRTPFENDQIRIVRYPFPEAKQTRLRRIWYTIMFPAIVLWQLLKLSPNAVIYYEPQSALGPAIYSLLNRKCDIFIHHHEYHDPAQFTRRGMLLARFNHWLEKLFLFHRASWISHTNEKRLELFKRDIPNLRDETLHVLCNYPPRDWSNQVSRKSAKLGVSSILRLVYVGSLSIRDTYLKELIDWLKDSPPNSITLDIFAYNTDEETRVFLTSITGKQDESNAGRAPVLNHVRYHDGGVDYYDLPKVLGEYDIGLILYKANTTNYKYNASNKLFEYLSCRLEVWFPHTMNGVKPYARQDSFPRITEVNFESLSDFPLASYLANRPDTVSQVTANCEDEFQKLLTRLRTIRRPH